MRHAPLIFAALLLSACETLPTDAPPAEAGPRLEGELELGDWRAAGEAETRAGFEEIVGRRYQPGLALSDASADLRGAEFSCGEAPPRDQGRGDPPTQVCRKTVTLDGCTHTWQVHLFAENESLARTRGLYDRRCGNEGLLGGPG